MNRTDTVIALPVCRPTLPTVELLLPLRPQVHRVRYTRRSPWTRLKRFVRAEGVAIGLCAPAPFALAYAIVQIAGAR